MSWSQHIRPRSLRMLIRLCETRNLSQVADEFNLTQPALSKWLKEFERAVGAPLFTRQARGVEPLPLALELARHARGILGRLDRAEAAIEQAKGKTTRQIAVGLSAMVAAVMLPDVLRAFHATHPEASVRLVENTIDLLLPSLQNGGLDIVIGRLDENGIPPDLYYERLGALPLCLAVDAAHPLAGKKQVRWKEALEYPWIAPSKTSPLRRRLELVLEAQGAGTPNVLFESSFVHANAELLRGTHFVLPVSVSLADAQGLNHRLNVPWPAKGIHGTMGVLWRPDTHEPEIVGHFIECIQAQSHLIAS